MAKPKTNLSKIRNSIQKKHGSDSITTWNSLNPIPRMPTSSLSIDDIFGGGLPRGRILQFFGAESGGKSAIAQSTSGAVINEGGTVAYIDAESGFDPNHALSTFAFDITNEDQVIFSQEDDAATIYDMVETFANNGVDVIIIDSTDAMMAEAEDEGDYDQSHMGVMARINSLALKKLKRIIADSGSVLILISQVRSKIGSYGGGDDTSGGKAFKFYSSIRARISRCDWIKKGEEVIGQVIKIKTVKNKTSPPFRECEVELLYDKGIGGSMENVNLGIKYGFIARAGAWYTLENGERFQGKEKTSEYLKQNPDIDNQLRQQIVERMSQIRGNIKPPAPEEIEKVENMDEEDLVEENPIADEVQ